MAKKELNAKKIIMDIVLILVLIVGIVLLFGVFGQDNSSLEDIKTGVLNNGNKITSNYDNVSLKLDELTTALKTNNKDLEKNVNKKVNAVAEKTVEVINTVDIGIESIILNDNNNALVLNENLMNVQTNLFNSLVNVEANLASHISTNTGIINDNIERVKNEMHVVGTNVLQGINDSNQLWATYMNEQFGANVAKLNTLETNLKGEIHGVGSTVLSGLAGHIDNHHAATNALIGALNTKVDTLATKNDISTAVSYVENQVSDGLDIIANRFNTIETLFNDTNNGVFAKLGNISTKVENVHNLLNTMDGKLDQILNNTAKKNDAEIATIILECSNVAGASTTASEAATCVTERLGY